MQSFRHKTYPTNPEYLAHVRETLRRQDEEDAERRKRMKIVIEIDCDKLMGNDDAYSINSAVAGVLSELSNRAYASMTLSDAWGSGHERDMARAGMNVDRDGEDVATFRVKA